MNITIAQVSAFIGIALPIVGVLFFLFKIYKKIEVSDKLTRTNLRAVMVMLDHFIGNGVGNGEFKNLREEVQNVLLNQN